MVAAAGGIVLAEAMGAGVAGWWFGVLAAVVLWFVRSGTRVGLFLAVAGVYGALHLLAMRDFARFPLAAELGRGAVLPATVTGVVADAPQVMGESVRFKLQLRSLASGNRQWTLRTTLMARTPARGDLRCGDLVELRGLVREPEPPRNPGQFDAPAWLRRQGIPAEMVVRSAKGVELLRAGHALGFRAFALRCREWIRGAITRDIADDPVAAAAISAMVLGTREDVPEDVDAAFLHSGTLHIFSVSGLHVALVAVLLWRVLSILRVPRRAAAVASIPLMLFYAVLTGWQPAAVRAAIMASVVLGGIALDRQPRFANNLCLAALVVLAMDTQQMFQAGAQLSFFVLGAIAGLTPWLQRKVRPHCEPDPFLPKALWTPGQQRLTAARLWLGGSFVTSLAAALGSAPLTLWHFQLVTPVSLLANVVQVPVAFMVLATACASASVAGVWGWLATVLNNANLVFARVCTASAAWFAAWPGAYWLWNPGQSVPPGSCVVTVFDVGEGGAVLIRTAGGKAWLIDTGRAELFRGIVRPGLNYAGVTQLDGVVLTHGDIDHVGGAPDCLRVFRPDTVLHGGGGVRSAALQAALTTAGPRARTAEAGLSVELEPGVTLDVLFAPGDAEAGTADDRCLVLRLTAAGCSVLFTGDAGFSTENSLVQAGNAPHSDVVVKGRHRSDVSGTADFLRAVQPQSVVCAGTDAIASERVPRAWIEEQERAGIRIFDQGACGAVTLTLGPQGVSAVSFLEPVAEAP